MALFCLKKIQGPLLVGELLKKTRKTKKMTIDEAAQLTRIAKKYLQIIERNKFKNLPQTKAHCLAYIRKYATILKLDSDKIVKQFTQEADLKNYTPTHPHSYLKIKSMNSIVIWIKKISLIIAILTFTGYLAWQINGILKPPRLVVFSPVEGYISNNLTTLVQGQTDKEVTLTINGKEIRTNDKGEFETVIDLSKGINSITISAIKKHGKTATLTRNIIMKGEKLPTTP